MHWFVLQNRRSTTQLSEMTTSLCARLYGRRSTRRRARRATEANPATWVQYQVVTNVIFFVTVSI